MGLKYKHSGKTKSEWEALDPIIVENEIIIEKDTNKLKIGDGTNSYSNLEYVGNEKMNRLKPGNGIVDPTFVLNLITLGFDLSGTNLSGIDLSNSNLSNIYFENSNLDSVNFTGAILTNTNLKNAIVRGAILENVTGLNSDINIALNNVNKDPENEGIGVWTLTWVDGNEWECDVVTGIFSIL